VIVNCVAFRRSVNWMFVLVSWSVSRKSIDVAGIRDDLCAAVRCVVVILTTKAEPR